MTEHKKKKKRVRFHATVATRDAERRHSFSEEHKRSLWYQKDEIMVMRRRISNIVNQRIRVTETEDSRRGLELKADKARQWERQMKIQQILDVYEGSFHVATMHATRSLRSFSIRLSKSDTRRSVLIAIEDATAANKIYKETMNVQMVDRCFL